MIVICFEQFFGIGPSIIIRGEGHYIYNDHGERFINGNSGVWNMALGYGREELVEAACKQMRELPFSSCWSEVHPRAIELAARLVEITQGHYDRVYLGANGSEAVETALKMARQYHRQSPHAADHLRHKIISLRGSYHGYSYGATTLSGLESYEVKFGPMLPGFIAIEPPYCYRCPYHHDGYPNCGLECASALEKAIVAAGPDTVAAFIMEPIMGDFSVVEPPEEYYRRVGELCQQYGLLFIVDEVTTGFGRAGKLFVSQDWKPRPDILCVGKAISGGYLPLSATLATGEIFHRFLGHDNYFMHGSTHSGHPVSCAVGLAAIDIILREKLPENAEKVGARFKELLGELKDKHALIGDVRGRGLMLAIELVKDRSTKEPLSFDETNEYLIDIVCRGLMSSIGANNLRFFPPLNIDDAIVDQIIHILDSALNTGMMASVERKARLIKELVRSKIN